MKVAWRWLQEYVRIDMTPEELAKFLTMSGFAVESIQPAGDDVCIDIDVTSNRADVLCIIGLAREIAVLTGAPLKMPSTTVKPDRKSGESPLSLVVRDQRLCPRYIGRVLTNVKIAPSPSWLKARLESVAIRPVNNVVDITNFVLMECGQPLHAFDRTLLREGAIVVRRAQEGEKIVAIDGKTYQLTPDMLVIADAVRPVAVAGIMGGKESEINERTTTIVLESAFFDPANIRTTSKQLSLASDSSYRFERGVSWEGVAWASARAARLIGEIAGGRISGEAVEDGASPPKPVTTSMRISRASKVLGIELKGTDVVKMMRKAGFAPRGKGDRWNLTVPEWRRDIRTEIDVVEEIARWRGYDNIPSDCALPMVPVLLNRVDRIERMVKEMLLSLGYSEAMTSSFAEEQEVRNCSLWSGEPMLELRSPDGRIDKRLRGSLLPCLYHIVRINEGYQEDIGDLFEIASVYYRSDGRPTEKKCLGVVSREGFSGAKGAVEELLALLGLSGGATFIPRDVVGFRPGASVAVAIGDTTVGFLGEVSDDVKIFYDIRGTIAAAEIDMEAVESLAAIDRKFHMFSRFPPMRRDVALVVDEKVVWAEIEACVREVSPDFLREIAFFDLYRGEKIAAGKKSVAFSLTFRSSERTLAKVEVDEAMKAVVAALKDKLGGTLRT